MERVQAAAVVAYRFTMSKQSGAPPRLQVGLERGGRHHQHLVGGLPPPRGLHSSTFRLNTSNFCGIRGAFRGRLRRD